MEKGAEDRAGPSSEVMAKEHGWHGDLEKNGEASSSNSEVKETGQIKDGNIQDPEDSKKKEENNHTVPFYKLFSFADPIDVLLMILGSVGALANGAALPLMTVLFGNLIQSFGGAKDNHDVVHRVSKVSLEFVYLAVGSGLASFFQVSCWMVTGERQATRIRNLYLKTILRQEIAFFDMETNTGEVVGRMSGDTVLIQDAMGEKVGKFIQLTSTFFGSFIVAFVQGWLLSLVMLSIIPLLVVAGAIMSIVVSKMASEGQASYGDAAVIVEQAIGSIRTVASFTGEKISVYKYKNALRKAYTASVQEGLAAGLGLGFAMLFMFCGYALGVWYGGRLILDKSKGYTGADVINVIFALLTGSFSLGQASPSLTAFAAGQAAAYKMFETISRKPEIDAYDTSKKKLDDVNGDIEFRDVYFSYPSRSDEQIFRGFSMLINSGTTAALVGESGSGKSTVISLIERFYDPQAGEVLIDGTNIKDLQLRWLRGKIGLVSQEPVLFASSIKDNISYGKDNATIEEIKVAAELANASKFIDKMPQGLDTMVGEHGTQLSGGQKQRIAIARAILKDPKILLLDEATSALDAESERVVQEALDRVMMNRTTVIVAHRLSTVRNADTIAVIHRGSIVEKGSHKELIKDPNGAYSQLIRLQEMSQNSDSLLQSDNEKSSLSVDRARRSSQKPSFKQSISRESSFGNSSRHNSFSAGFGLPVGVDVPASASDADNSSTTEQSKEVPLSRLASLNKPEIPILLFGAASAIINGLIFPAFGLILSSVINTFYQPPHKLKQDSKFWSLMFLIFGVVSLVAEPARSYFFGLAGSRLIRRIRFMTFEKVVNMEIAWFDDPENSSGAVGARLSADAATVRSLVGDALALIVQNITTLIAGLLIAFIANWQLSLIILAMIPLIGLNGWIEMKFMKGFSADAKVMYEEASQVANDAVGSIRTVASFSAEEKVMELYKKKCEGPMKTGIRQGLISGIGFGVSFFLLFCVYAACFYAGARLVEDGKTTFGKVFRVFFALAMASLGISQSSSLATDSTKAKSATASVFSVLDRKSKIDPSDDSGMTLDDLKGNIEFLHISFKYPTRPDVQIFQDLCLSVKSGKTVALVGESGSGKSTAIALLQRFYDPDSGHILLDGIELQKFKLRWLRQQMGLVSQEPVLFNDTIRANIAYGKEGKATEAEIGYDTMVGERGIQLSGGQKQRIAISRAIVKEPKILLFDEATSALDAESERIVQDALDRVMVNRTTVVVAHRLTTIKNADLIAVVKNGVIIEKGKHDILMNINDGAYASLVALQSSETTS
ncbi:hypothetical protein IEQ34_010085 [Dendrobium chrysotoxum]|uniref:Uncharacterized protein n=1 Tax=Dendrobium chrysotoxum TaxID=161865 RepID=A0AAV7GKZ2_DENCH|nr:hypothetical protein IEQ34_010085 [Dendrobium chrysotoxum]